ncbi:MAG TPA: hypothetical protein VMW16_11980 [Sedimentisphaerales bacterium]|nr:hypothetical protein [Sedimentisphaerales bacterium]
MEKSKMDSCFEFEVTSPDPAQPRPKRADRNRRRVGLRPVRQNSAGGAADT